VTSPEEPVTSPEETVRRPLYARALRLRHIHPSGLWCFVFFEGVLAVGVLLALAEFVSWWAVPVLPVVVAVMVKINDLVAGGLRRVAPTPHAVRSTRPVPPPRVARQVSRDLTDTMDPVDSVRQRFRQSARRRYR
jgi:hypothetical protein